MLDNCGFNYCGKGFEDFIYKKMGFIEVDD